MAGNVQDTNIGSQDTKAGQVRQTFASMPSSAFAWVFTANLSADGAGCLSLGDFDVDSATEEQFHAFTVQFAERYMAGYWTERQRALGEQNNGIGVVFEVGHSGNPHMQGYVCSKSKIPFDRVRNRLPGAHIEVMRGAIDQVRDYLFKRGSAENERKSDTSRCEPVFLGECHISNGYSDGTSTLADIDAFIDAGATPDEIIAQGAKYAYQRRTIEDLFNARRRSSIPRYRDVECEWHFGKPGTGKTYVFKQLLDAGEDVYKCNGASTDPFQNYRYEDVLFIDELKPDTRYFDHSTLLSVMDKYEYKPPRRYEDIQAAWTKVYVTSVYSPREFWELTTSKREREIDDYEQLARRLDRVVEHSIDEGRNDDARYVVSVVECR